MTLRLIFSSQFEIAFCASFLYFTADLISFGFAKVKQYRGGNMQSLVVSLLGFLFWMDMAIKLPANIMDSLDACKRAIEIIDKKKLEQTVLNIMLQTLKNVTPEQKSLARVDIEMSCRPEDEVR